jgi:hypothetical protein
MLPPIEMFLVEDHGDSESLALQITLGIAQLIGFVKRIAKPRQCRLRLANHSLPISMPTDVSFWDSILS